MITVIGANLVDEIHSGDCLAFTAPCRFAHAPFRQWLRAKCIVTSLTLVLACYAYPAHTDNIASHSAATFFYPPYGLGHLADVLAGGWTSAGARSWLTNGHGTPRSPRTVGLLLRSGCGSGVCFNLQV